jgi:hypothetical protein
MWRLTTMAETNDKGDFYNWSVEKVGTVDNRDLLQEAKAFRESIMRGEVKAQAEAGGEGGGSAGGQRQDDEIPF